MRRTYQDLARAAGIHDVVTRAIFGHLTETMQHHYSTARGAEIRDALALVAGLAIGPEAPIIDIETARAKRHSQAVSQSGGEPGGELLEPGSSNYRAGEGIRTLRSEPKNPKRDATLQSCRGVPWQRRGNGWTLDPPNSARRGNGVATD